MPAFSGLDHIYIVTMTRIGYADMPPWLGINRLRVIDDVAGKMCPCKMVRLILIDLVLFRLELARELLELFVEGPEGDLVVESYVSLSQLRPDGTGHPASAEPSTDKHLKSRPNAAGPGDGDETVEDSQEEGSGTDEEMEED